MAYLFFDDSDGLVVEDSPQSEKNEVREERQRTDRSS